MNKSLSSLLADLRTLSIANPTDPAISGIQYDSRRIQKGDLFVAFPGIHTDGHDYIQAAVARGAVAILHEKAAGLFFPGVSYIRVDDVRLAASRIAAAFYDWPSSSLYTIGVTGTEGKSTTVSLIYQLLNLSGAKAGFFSTVMSDSGSGEKPNPEHQTTPEATSVQKMLAEMRDSGCSYAVVEASSHGLSERTGRLSDVAFDIGIMTNVTREHLEFHGTWEQYRSDKANLFRKLDAQGHQKSIRGKPASIPSFGVVNADDPSASYFAACTTKPVVSYSTKGADATMSARDIVTDRLGSSFVIKAGDGRAEARINLPGAFNVGNSLAALLAVSGATGKPWRALLPLLPLLAPVRGRMMNIDCGQPFEVIIDYAHTPTSFETILPSIKERVAGKVFCLFGSGGERDTEKRPRQARVASEYCDVLILTDEDPRGENPLSLLEDIAAGCSELVRGERLFLIPDRPAAIRMAFSMAAPGDAVLLLGKGHENSIIYADRAIPYDEEAEAVAALREKGFAAHPAAR